MANTDYISNNTTVFSNVSLYGGTVQASLARASTVSVSRVNLTASSSSLNLNQGKLISARTIAASALTVSAANTNVDADEVVFVVGGASGASLAIHSGGTVYIFNSAISAKAT